jgi:hypothetical protein
MGQVVPARADRIVLEDAEGRQDATEADEAGFFLLRRPAPGPVRLRWYTPSASAVTEWMVL